MTRFFPRTVSRRLTALSTVAKTTPFDRGGSAPTPAQATRARRVAMFISCSSIAFAFTVPSTTSHFSLLCSGFCVQSLSASRVETFELISFGNFGPYLINSQSVGCRSLTLTLHEVRRCVPVPEAKGFKVPPAVQTAEPTVGSRLSHRQPN